MRIVFWSFFVFICSFTLLLPLFDPSWIIPEDYALVPIITILVLSMILQLEAMGFLKAKGALKKLQSEKKDFEAKEKKEKTSLLSKIQTLETFLTKEKSKKKEAQKELSSLGLKQTRLENELKRNRTARKESELRLSDLKKTLSQKEENEEAITLLSLLQKKGRLLDFLMDDITSYEDTQIGAASRIVHEGCSSVLKEYFDIKPLVDSEEGSNIELKENDKASLYKLVGNYNEENSPKKGILLHKGWKTNKINLPKSFSERKGSLKQIISPAEVEIN